MKKLINITINDPHLSAALLKCMRNYTPSEQHIQLTVVAVEPKLS